MAILGSLKVTLRYVFYFWIGIKKSPKANDNGAFLEFWLREQDLNLRPSGYEPDELPDCSIPRQLTRFISSFFGAQPKVVYSLRLFWFVSPLNYQTAPFRDNLHVLYQAFLGLNRRSCTPFVILGLEPNNLPNCSIPRQIFRGMALKSVALYVLPRRCQSLFRYIHFILEYHRFCSRKNQLL